MSLTKYRMLTHRVFLLWLLYLVLVIFGLCVASYLELLQIALHYDRSYLTVLLFALYGIAELAAGRQAWLISRENLITDQAMRWLATHKLQQIIVTFDKVKFLPTLACSQPYDLPKSSLADHVTLLCIEADAGQRNIQQTVLLDILADRVYARSMIGDFLAARIVWIGIFATILGVIMAFWPMIDGITIDAMRTNLGGFFGGIAVAFIPTAVSFACKIILDFNTKIIASGVDRLIDKIASIAETEVLPFLASDGKITVT
jgi:hypothetical protein